MPSIHSPPLAVTDLPPVGGALGTELEDFMVDEELAWPLSGDGEHLWVRIQKRDLTTQQAIDAIARAASVRARDVGSAGMKDKHAVTTQWLSLPASAVQPDGWQLPENVVVLEQTRHSKKLRTGQLARNRFRIRLRGVPEGGLERARALAARLSETGIPNYFGAQRFGYGGQNLERAVEWLASGGRGGRNPGRFYMKLYPSVVQSEIFNRYLTLRRARGFDRLLAGDVVRLDGSGSVFVVDDPARESPRLASGDVHLTGPMPGPKMKAAYGIPAELEAQAAEEAGITPMILEALARFVDGTRRDLLIRPDKLEVAEIGPGILELAFSLSSGSYATEVVRNFTHGDFFARFSGEGAPG